MANTLKFGNGQWATGNGQVLAYNDENSNFKPLPFNFTRASSGTVVNQSGLIETVGSGLPRIDFLGNTKGALLLEPSRTNSISYSEDFSQSDWSKFRLSVSTDSIISPDGNSNTYEITEDSTNNSHVLRKYFGSLNTDYSFSFFVKSKSGDRYIELDLGHTTNKSIFDIENGIIISDTTNNAKITSLDNDWYKISISDTVLLNENSYDIRLVDKSTGSDTYLGNGTSGVYIYGAQLEQGSYATSYIPTQGGVVTRLADSCNNGGNEQVINSTEGVFYFEGSALADDGTNRYLSLNDGTTNNYIYFRYVSTSNQYLFRTQVGGTIVNTLFGFLNDATQNHKFAFKFKSGDYAMWVDGVEISTDTSSTIFTSNTLSNLEYSFPTDGGDGFASKTRDIKVYNTALTDQELQALTTI